jgi:uncharacterized protein YabE (DUF348 family)
VKRIFGLTLVILLLACACQPQNAGISISILDGEKVIRLQAESNTPAGILSLAGITLSTSDKIQFHGADLPADFMLPPGGNYTLQIRRAHLLTLITPDGQSNIRTTEPNVGQALAQTGLQLYAADYIAPPLETPITANITVVYRPARDLSVSTKDGTIAVKSSQQTVGKALAAAGLALFGLDKSLPAESEPLPIDGQIKIIRVKETVTLLEKAIPFPKSYIYSLDQAAGEQKVVQAGETGLTISRVRTRYENGAEVAQITEAETIVRQPVESIISLSTQAQIQTLDTPDGQIQYWRAVQMYTTSYSPCGSGTPKCSYGTASGLPVKHGVVALIPSLYNQLVGSRVYIPGYGVAVIGDVGGGFPDGRPWIDLGFSDDDYQNWSGMHTVYFLAPAPASIPPGLN